MGRGRRTLVGAALSAVALAIAAGAALAGGGATDIGGYGWTTIRTTTPAGPSIWAPRAGLQAVELRNDLFVIGGRGAFSTSGPTPLYGDVWRSADGGATWARTADGAFPARAYFGAVTHGGRMYVIGGQNFDTVANPAYPAGCAFLPPGVPCLPFLPASTFFDDVWSSRDGVTWTRETADAPWDGRAGLSVAVHGGAIIVAGGSRGDDAATGGSGRVLYDDVWSSRDGRTWTRLTADAPWAPRAGGALVSTGGFLYLLGGERGFSCGFGPNPACNPATATLYFNDVWRSRDGRNWEQVTPAAGWSPRPGHQCVPLLDQIACFGGYGEVPGNPAIPANPLDIWTSRDGASWTQLQAPAAPVWNATGPADGRYDFDALVVTGGRFGGRPSILTFGGDRERFGLPDAVNATLLENDVWRLAP